MPTKRKETYDLFMFTWSPPTEQEEREPETHNGKTDEPLFLYSEREGGH